MSYIGNPIVSTDFPVDYKSGNGSTTAFTLSVAPASVNSIDVQVSGVAQSPQTYSVSGTTLTFSAAPPSGTNNIVVRHLGVAGIPNTPSTASVVTTSIANNAVTPAKMANGGAEFGMRNRIINGAMVIDQRNAGASVTPIDGQYTLDRWVSGLTQASKFSVQQNAGAVTPPVGFTNYLGATSLSAYSIGSGDTFFVGTRVEGFNVADLGWGTANAKTVTLSFQVYSSLTGTFGGSLSNNAFNYSYPFTYSIPVANTWTTISITIAGATSGTWLTTNGLGIRTHFSLGTGSTYSGNAGSWSANGYFSATGATSVVGTSGATFYITGVQLEAGTSATGFEYRQYTTELQLCQRYYQFIGGVANGFPIVQSYQATGTNMSFPITFAVTMRTTPTATVNGTWFVSNCAQPTSSFMSNYGASIRSTVTSTGSAYYLPDTVDDTITYSAEL